MVRMPYYEAMTVEEFESGEWWPKPRDKNGHVNVEQRVGLPAAPHLQTAFFADGDEVEKREKSGGKKPAKVVKGKVQRDKTADNDSDWEEEEEKPKAKAAKKQLTGIKVAPNATPPVPFMLCVPATILHYSVYTILIKTISMPPKEHEDELQKQAPLAEQEGGWRGRKAQERDIEVPLNRCELIRRRQHNISTYAYALADEELDRLTYRNGQNTPPVKLPSIPATIHSCQCTFPAVFAVHDRFTEKEKEKEETKRLAIDRFAPVGNSNMEVGGEAADSKKHAVGCAFTKEAFAAHVQPASAPCPFPYVEDSYGTPHPPGITHDSRRLFPYNLSTVSPQQGAQADLQEAKQLRIALTKAETSTPANPAAIPEGSIIAALQEAAAAQNTSNTIEERLYDSKYYSYLYHLVFGGVGGGVSSTPNSFGYYAFEKGFSKPVSYGSKTIENYLVKAFNDDSEEDVATTDASADSLRQKHFENLFATAAVWERKVIPNAYHIGRTLRSYDVAWTDGTVERNVPGVYLMEKSSDYLNSVSTNILDGNVEQLESMTASHIVVPTPTHYNRILGIMNEKFMEFAVKWKKLPPVERLRAFGGELPVQNEDFDSCLPTFIARVLQLRNQCVTSRSTLRAQEPAMTKYADYPTAIDEREVIRAEAQKVDKVNFSYKQEEQKTMVSNRVKFIGAFANLLLGEFIAEGRRLVALIEERKIGLNEDVAVSTPPPPTTAYSAAIHDIYEPMMAKFFSDDLFILTDRHCPLFNITRFYDNEWDPQIGEAVRIGPNLHIANTKEYYHPRYRFMGMLQCLNEKDQIASVEWFPQGHDIEALKKRHPTYPNVTGKIIALNRNTTVKIQWDDGTIEDVWRMDVAVVRTEEDEEEDEEQEEEAEDDDADPQLAAPGTGASPAPLAVGPQAMQQILQAAMNMFGNDHPVTAAAAAAAAQSAQQAGGATSSTNASNPLVNALQGWAEEIEKEEIEKAQRKKAAKQKKEVVAKGLEEGAQDKTDTPVLAAPDNNSTAAQTTAEQGEGEDILEGVTMGGRGGLWSMISSAGKALQGAMQLQMAPSLMSGGGGGGGVATDNATPALVTKQTAPTNVDGNDNDADDVPPPLAPVATMSKKVAITTQKRNALFTASPKPIPNVPPTSFVTCPILGKHLLRDHIDVSGDKSTEASATAAASSAPSVAAPFLRRVHAEWKLLQKHFGDAEAIEPPQGEQTKSASTAKKDENNDENTLVIIDQELTLERVGPVTGTTAKPRPQVPKSLLTRVVPRKFAVSQPNHGDEGSPAFFGSNFAVVDADCPTPNKFLLLPSYSHSKVFVKVSEEEPALIKFLISGPIHTPCYQSLLAFDLALPRSFPIDPPIARFHSYGFTLNPNLYEDGTVCLSLLGTWDGYHNSEKWTPAVSSVYQVIASIQSQILGVSEPYYNEAGYEANKGSAVHAKKSHDYSEYVALRRIDLLVAMAKAPPSDWLYEVREHFTQFVPHIIHRLRQLCSRYSPNKTAESAPVDNDFSIYFSAANANAAPDDGSITADGIILPPSKGIIIALEGSLIDLERTYVTLLKQWKAQADAYTLDSDDDN